MNARPPPSRSRSRSAGTPRACAAASRSRDRLPSRPAVDRTRRYVDAMACDGVAPVLHPDGDALETLGHQAEHHHLRRCRLFVEDLAVNGRLVDFGPVPGPQGGCPSRWPSFRELPGLGERAQMRLDEACPDVTDLEAGPDAPDAGHFPGGDVGGEYLLCAADVAVELSPQSDGIRCTRRGTPRAQPQAMVPGSRARQRAGGTRPGQQRRAPGH